MTKLEYWKSVENDDFIKACKDAGINLVSTNVSDARKEFMTIDFSAKYPNLRWRDLADKLSSLFLVGLKLKSLTSYEYGKMFTLSARLDEESTWDRLPHNVSYEDNVNFSDSNKLDSYIIEGCKLILRSVPLYNLRSAISRYRRHYGELDKKYETSWAGLIYGLFRDDENGSFEADSYIMGKTYEVLKDKSLEGEFITNILCELIYDINHYETEAERDEYDNSLRPYILGEDPKYVDIACNGVNKYSTLPKFIIKATSPIRTEDELEELLEEDLDYEDESEDDEYNEESEYDIEMETVKIIDEISLNQPIKSKNESISSPISVEQVIRSPLTKIEVSNYNGLTIMSELVKVADSDSLKEIEMSGLFTIKGNKGLLRILVDDNGGVYLEKSILDELDKEYIKDILIRFTTPDGSYSEDLEFFNKWNNTAGFLKLTDFIMTKSSKTSKKKHLNPYDEYEGEECDRLGIKDYRVYWRKKTNRIPKDYVILGKVHMNWSGLLNSSIRFIDKLTEKIYKFIIKNDCIYIDKNYITKDNLPKTKYLISEILGENIVLDKWII